jgi:cytochrome c peroxidase
MGPALGGLDFQKMGKRADYFSIRGTDILEADLGRFNVTKEDKDRHYFKVPVLRNIEVTHPYFHDGTVQTLREAIDTMAVCQLDVKLSEPQIASMEKFLIALTGQYKGVPLTEIQPVEVARN